MCGELAIFLGWPTVDDNLWLICECSAAQLCPTLCDPMDCNLQAPLSVDFSRQEYWSGLPFPPPWDSPNPGIRLTSPALAGGSLSQFHLGSPASGPLGNKQWAPRRGEGGGGGRAI